MALEFHVWSKFRVISTVRVFHVKQLYSHVQNLYGGYCVYFHFPVFMLECFLLLLLLLFFFFILHRRWTHLNKLLMLETFARQCGLLSVI